MAYEGETLLFRASEVAWSCDCSRGETGRPLNYEMGAIAHGWCPS